MISPFRWEAAERLEWWTRVFALEDGEEEDFFASTSLSTVLKDFVSGEAATMRVLNGESDVGVWKAVTLLIPSRLSDNAKRV